MVVCELLGVWNFCDVVDIVIVLWLGWLFWFSELSCFDDVGWVMLCWLGIIDVVDLWLFWEVVCCGLGWVLDGIDVYLLLFFDFVDDDVDDLVLYEIVFKRLLINDGFNGEFGEFS